MKIEIRGCKIKPQITQEPRIESHFTILRNPITNAINHETQLDEALKGSTDYIINYIAEPLPESDVIPNPNPFEAFLFVTFYLILIFNHFKIDLSH